MDVKKQLFKFKIIFNSYYFISNTFRVVWTIDTQLTQFIFLFFSFNFIFKLFVHSIVLRYIFSKNWKNTESLILIYSVHLFIVSLLLFAFSLLSHWHNLTFFNQSYYSDKLKNNMINHEPIKSIFFFKFAYTHMMRKRILSSHWSTWNIKWHVTRHVTSHVSSHW